jgi:outer membrane protein assembly factor BamB
MLPTCCRFALIAVVWMICCPLRAGNWPQWRGPDGDGVSREAELPVAWSEKAGVKWKCKLPEWGNSTPAIWGNAVFLTSHVDNRRLLLLKIDKSNGKIVWEREVATASIQPVAHDKLSKPDSRRGHQQFHESQNMASPSPITDGKVVIVHFGNGELAAYDFDGRRLWRHNLQDDYGPYSIWWGHANSPVLYEDLVISVCIQDSCRELPESDRPGGKPLPSYVVAHDKRTGKERWYQPRMTPALAECCDSYITPVLRRSDEQTELVVMGGQMLDAYDPASGRQLWYLPGLVGSRTITGPVVAHGMIYATEGMRRNLLAVQPGGPGKRSRADVVWKLDQGTPDSPTPVVWGESLFLVTNDGVARCLDAHDGRLRWKERLKGEYRASPLAVEGRIYFLNTTGLCTVLSASTRVDRLTQNQLDDQTVASPAISDGNFFIRGRKWLYCLSK